MVLEIPAGDSVRPKPYNNSLQLKCISSELFRDICTIYFLLEDYKE